MRERLELHSEREGERERERERRREREREGCFVVGIDSRWREIACLAALLY